MTRHGFNSCRLPVEMCNPCRRHLLALAEVKQTMSEHVWYGLVVDGPSAGRYIGYTKPKLELVRKNGTVTEYEFLLDEPMGDDFYGWWILVAS